MTRPDKTGSTEIWRHGNPSDPFSFGELDTTPPRVSGLAFTGDGTELADFARKGADQIARDFDQVSFEWSEEKTSARRVTCWTLAAAVLVAAACIAIVWGMR